MTGTDSSPESDSNSDPEQEPLDFQTIYRRAPLLTVVAAVAFANLFVFGASALWNGGTAAGTFPSRQGFVVVSHGSETVVSENVWLFSLFYTVTTMLFLPQAGLLLAAKQRHRLKMPRHYVIVAFAVLWDVMWCWACLRDGGLSLLDYLRMG